MKRGGGEPPPRLRESVAGPGLNEAKFDEYNRTLEALNKALDEIIVSLPKLPSDRASST
jgi:hypothetical protein